MGFKFSPLIKPRRKSSAGGPKRGGYASSGNLELDEEAQSALAQVWNDFPLTRMPDLEWRTYSVTAGTANYRDWKICLSRKVLQGPEQVRTTLLHEYAHLMAVDRFGMKAASHGAEWKSCMAMLGLPPTVRHSYEVDRSNRSVVQYRCQKCGQVIEARRRLARTKVWGHRNCGGRLILVGIKRPQETDSKL